MQVGRRFLRRWGEAIVNLSGRLRIFRRRAITVLRSSAGAVNDAQGWHGRGSGAPFIAAMPGREEPKPEVERLERPPKPLGGIGDTWACPRLPPLALSSPDGGLGDLFLCPRDASHRNHATKQSVRFRTCVLSCGRVTLRNRQMPVREHDETRNKLARTARRKAIVQGLIEQRPVTAVAQAIGISRKTLYAELHQPETQALIRSWMEPHHNAIRRMIPRALAAVNTGLKPSQEMRDRLQAVKTLGTVMGWAQGSTDGDSDNQTGRRWSGEFVELLGMFRDISIDVSAAKAKADRKA